MTEYIAYAVAKGFIAYNETGKQDEDSKKNRTINLHNLEIVTINREEVVRIMNNNLTQHYRPDEIGSIIKIDRTQLERLKKSLKTYDAYLETLDLGP
ncbi:MAG: hypothetical protein AABX16_00515 [Nanoarchaeota archaeon]